jgi:hypothetical protein
MEGSSAPKSSKSSKTPRAHRDSQPPSLIVNTTCQAIITHKHNTIHVTLTPLSAHWLSPTNAERVTADTLIEREQSLIDALLLRFRNIIELAPLPEGEVTKELAAAQAFQTKVETAALVYPTSFPLSVFLVVIVTLG